MKTLAVVAATAMILGVPAVQAEESKPAAQAGMPEMPLPTKEHQWLKQFEGEWTFENETVAGPTMPAMKCSGTESCRMLGGFWMLAESESDIMGEKEKAITTVGYDPAEKKYIGTFVCSVGSELWHYVGFVDDGGKTLTLEAEGPNMMDLTKRAKYKDVTEFTDADHKTLTSYIQIDDGTWVKFMTAKYERKK